MGEEGGGRGEGMEIRIPSLIQALQNRRREKEFRKVYVVINLYILGPLAGRRGLIHSIEGY